MIAGHLERAMLFGLSPNDPLTIGVAVGTLALVSVIASIWPARRAAAVNPLIALRAG
jgi:ABC-type antimicrobial peptide transport system permease subunit